MTESNVKDFRPPVVQALLLADHVYQDVTTGKHVISGVFDQIFFFPQPQQPTLDQPDGTKQNTEGAAAELSSVAVPPESRHRPKSGSPFLFISLTEIYESAELALRFVKLSTYEVLMEGFVSVRHPNGNPVETVRLALQLPNLPIKGEGAYALELLWDDELIGSCRLSVKLDPRVNARED